MIKVMQHFADGGEVEFSADNFKTILGTANKKDDEDLGWDWEDFEYRIKEPKQKVSIEKWLVRDSLNGYVIIESSNVNHFRMYKKVKLLDTYKVEL